MLKKQSNHQPQQLLEHAAYLVDELNALKSVISAVPYNEKPPGQASIIQMLMSINHAQVTYYGPLIKRIFSEAQPDFSDINSVDDADLDVGEIEPNTLIEEIIEKRSGLLRYFYQIPEDDWERVATLNGKEVTMLGILDELIQYERGKFKEIAERVLVIDASRSTPKPPKQ